MLWQTPTIALTAQAFLLTIALNPASPSFATILSAGLGIVVALLSAQLMAKHRFLNLMDRTQLHAIERRLEIEHLSNREYFYSEGAYRVPDRLAKDRGPAKEGVLQGMRSYRVWMWGMFIFVAANASIIFLEIWVPALLSTD